MLGIDFRNVRLCLSIFRTRRTTKTFTATARRVVPCGLVHRQAGGWGKLAAAGERKQAIRLPADGRRTIIAVNQDGAEGRKEPRWPKETDEIYGIGKSSRVP